MDESDLNNVEAKIASLLASLQEAQDTLAPIADELVKINADEYQLKQSYTEQMTLIQQKKQQAHAKKQQAEAIATKINYEIQAAKQKIELKKQETAKKKAEAERLERETAMFATLGARFENATLGAPWREWAKDHQLEAGRKIAIDRYVILADAMGLGKTLSSIILSDMTEQGTREVNPEFPLLGETITQNVPPQKVWTAKAVEAAKAQEWPFGSGPLEQFLKRIPALTPFDDALLEFRGSPLKDGQVTPYLQYDISNKLTMTGYIDTVEAHTKELIVNSIERPVGRRVLYFCPSPLLRNVLEEWRRWSPHRNVTYIGAMTKGERNFALSFLPKLDDYVIIVNYEAWRRDKNLLEELAACKFDTVIIDEAHSIKDMKSVGYRGVKQILDACEPEYVIPMTGTPILNRPQELFTLLTLVNPKEFNSEKDFLWRYCEEYWLEESTAPKYRFKDGGLEALAKKISKNFMRRTKDQAGIVLPEKTIIHHDLDRDDEGYPEQSKAREQMKKFATIVINEKAGKAIQATVIIALITRLRQIETWPGGVKAVTTVTDDYGNESQEVIQLDVNESQKVDYTIRFDNETQEWEGLIPDSIEDERIVVFSQFKAPLHELKRRIELMGRTCVIIDGDTSSAIRDQARHDFDRSHTPDRSNSKWDVALCNYKAAGVGLNLTAATSMVVLDSEWNPGKRDQAYDRLHRIGQTENVTINVLNVKNTIDDWLENSIMKEKEKVVQGFEGAMLGADDLLNAIESGLI